ncbi:MAG: glycosyltransferase family 4 protein [Stenomitos rutilans HA7619-LM2]|nr:glycosyltransferase family 4 protein [Stenomitos rutilans HA7619-LM2]
MNVLLLNANDIHGGAARAAYRLHQGLTRLDVTTQMLVQVKSSGDATVVAPHTRLGKNAAKLRPLLDPLPSKLYLQREQTAFSTQWVPDSIAPKIEQLAPDLVNLHWVCDGFLQIETLATLKRPIVWTLHDMWAFTGGCHYSQECDRYMASCGSCPELHSHQTYDLSRWIWTRKARAWKDLNLTIVTPSHWLAKCASTSSLLQEVPVEVIPYGIDLEQYKPIERSLARHILNLPQDKQLILFTAARATTDRRKGFHLLREALEHFKQSDWAKKTELLVVGASQSTDSIALGLPTRYLGRLIDDVALALTYAAADVFVAPSMQDNLPNTVMEAIACGTPCVAFNIGGMPDLIEHQRNGYLAQPFHTEELAHGIAWILADPERHHQLAEAARQKAEQEFALKTQASRYVTLFHQLLTGTRPSSHH